MPLYEFRCSKCRELFELLVMNNDEDIVKCPHCSSEAFERVLSTASYNMGSRGGGSREPRSQTRTCSGGSCTTYDIPGPA